MRLKILGSAILLIIVGYILFWHYMAGELEEKFEQWAEQQKPSGLRITYDDIDISGFPYRMEFALLDLKLVKTRERKSPVVIKTPKITLIAFPWKINHGVIISEQGNIRLGYRNWPEVTLGFQKSRSSLIVNLSERKFNNASIILQDVNWFYGQANQNASQSRAGEIRFHVMKPTSAEAENNLDLPMQLKLYLEGRDIIAQEIPVGIFGKKADQVRIDMRLHGNKIPMLNKNGLSQWRDTGGTLAVKKLSVNSGKLDLELDGEMTLDQELRPLGAFASQIHGIDHIVQILSGHSAFQKEPGSVVLKELDSMSKTVENGTHKGKKALDLAISMQNGLLFLGPIPVLELPAVAE